MQKQLEQAKSLASTGETLCQYVCEILADLYTELCREHPLLVRKNDQARDELYLRKRVEAEGITFLTVVLPRLGEWADELVTGIHGEGNVLPPAGFGPYCGLDFPKFLRPVWAVFSRPTYDSNACSATDANIYRILRTLLFGLKKLEQSPSEDQIRERLAEFVSNDQALPSIYEEEITYARHDALRAAQFVAESLLGGYHAECRWPKHGPGAVAGGEKGNAKYAWTTLYESLHREFPYYDYHYGVRCADGTPGTFPRPFMLASDVAQYRALQRVPEPTARLLFVPKDSRGPRTICCEPKELMWVQQGLAEDLARFIEQKPILRDCIHLQDQSFNANAALLGSQDGSVATIDLSDASDRVSANLVRFLFPERVTRKWLAARSTAVTLPNGSVFGLNKFAPMGSALCFPVESLVFLSICLGAIMNRTKGTLASCAEAVLVYGDDIVVPTEHADAVMRALEAADLKVNRRKSFAGGTRFRESCGTDAFCGHIVTPFRLRKVPPTSPTDGAGLVRTVRLASNCQYVLPKASRWLLSAAESLVGPIPRVRYEQPFLSFITSIDPWENNDFPGVEWSSKRCQLTFVGYSLKTKRVFSKFTGSSRLLATLTRARVDEDPQWVVERASTRIVKRRIGILTDSYGRA